MSLRSRLDSTHSFSSLYSLGNDMISIVFTYLPLRSHHDLSLTCRRLGMLARRPASRTHCKIPATTKEHCIERIKHMLRYQPFIYTLDASLHSYDDFFSTERRHECLLTSLEEFRRRGLVPHRLLLRTDDLPYGDTLELWIRSVSQVHCWGRSISPRFLTLDNIVQLSCENFRPCDLVSLPTSLCELDLTFRFDADTSLAVDSAEWCRVTHSLTRLRRLELRRFPVRWNDPWWRSLHHLTSLYTLTVSNVGPNPPHAPLFFSMSSEGDTDTSLLSSIRDLSIHCGEEIPGHWPPSHEVEKWTRWMPFVEQFQCRNFYTLPTISTWTHLSHLRCMFMKETDDTVTPWPPYMSYLHLSPSMCDSKPTHRPFSWFPYITRVCPHLLHLSLAFMSVGQEECTVLGRGLPHLRSLSLINCRVDPDTFRVVTLHFTDLCRFVLRELRPSSSSLFSFSDVFPLMANWTNLVELEWCCSRLEDSGIAKFAEWCPRSLRSLTTTSNALTGQGIISALTLLPPHLQHWYLLYGKPVFSSSQKLTIDLSTCTLHY